MWRAHTLAKAMFPSWRSQSVKDANTTSDFPLALCQAWLALSRPAQHQLLL